MRLFAAICFPKEFRKCIERYIAELKNAGVRGKFTAPENLHLTLAFFGETTRAGEIIDAINEVRFSPFEIKTSRTGKFGDTLWLGISGEKDLNEIAARLCKALDERSIEFDRKPFKPHITLARKTIITAGLPEPPERAMTVERIALMKSEFAGGKRIYTEITGKR